MTAVPATLPTVSVSGRMLTVLLAGRVLMRGSGYIRVIALLAVWGSLLYSQYAHAVGLCAWMLHVSAGVEKACLKLVPRSRRLTADLVRGVLLLAVAPVAIALVALALTLAFADLDTAVYPAAAVDTTALGLVLVTASLQRLSGRPRRDAVGSLVLAMGICVTTVVVWRLDLRPVHYLLCMSSVSLSVAAWQMLRLPPDWWRVRSGRRIGAGLARAAAMLGVTELLAAVAVSVCYAALGLAGRTDESTALYLCLIISGGAMAAMLALMRIVAPRISARQRGTGAVAGRRRAAMLLDAAAVTAGVAAVVVLVAAGSPVPPVVVFVIGGAALTGVLVVQAYAVTLLENIDAVAVRLTVVGAGVGLLVTAAAAAVTVPLAGAEGALAALVLGVCGNAAITGARLRRRYRPGPATSLVRREL